MCITFNIHPQTLFDNLEQATLNLKGCTSIEKLPSNLFVDFRSRILDIRSTAIRELPDLFTPKSSFHFEGHFDGTRVKSLPQGLLDLNAEKHSGSIRLFLNGSQIPKAQIDYILDKKTEQLTIRIYKTVHILILTFFCLA